MAAILFMAAFLLMPGNASAGCNPGEAQDIHGVCCDSADLDDCNVCFGTVNCDDGDACTIDACAGEDICSHTPTGLTAVVSGNAPSLCGQCNGSASVNVTGGTPPYTYQWSTGATTQAIGQGTFGTRICIDAGNTVTDVIMGTDTFKADQYFSGGTTYQNNNAGLVIPPIYKNERFVGAGGFFNYNVPVSNGNYTVELHFAEIFYGVPGGNSTNPPHNGKRVFNVLIEGTTVLSNYDILDTVAPGVPVIEIFATTVTDGVLTITLGGVDGKNPKINAFCIRPAQADGLCPGNYTVTVTDVSGCTTTASTTLSGPGCDDLDLCTTDDCIGGECVHTTVNCDDNDACTDDICDSENGCQHEAIDCDDADACTDDGCDIASGCTHEATDCDDNNACTDDLCDSENGCEHEAIDCDDADACTDDGCDIASGCTHEATDCDDNNACTTDLCNSESGCQHEAIDCDDADACTDDGCDTASGCTHESVDCHDNDACTFDLCDSGIGCQHLAINCDDENACTDDNCDVEAGCTNKPIDCDDDDICTDDACVEGTCTYTEVPGCNDPCKDIVCDDDDACTEDLCDDGNCQFTAIVCADTDLCTQDECIEGVCHFIPDNCDDGDDCTEDICLGSGFCDYVEINCDDHDECTEDACASGVCENTEVICTDGNNCTTDACDNGLCVFTEISCDDSDECTDDACDLSDGTCTHTGTDCNDGDFCTDDLCNEGVCSHTPKSCDDGSECTSDACDNIGNACINTAVICDDEDACTNDLCDVSTGCYTQPVNCADASLCTGDLCDGSSGCYYTAISCDDGDGCTIDDCAAATGCTHQVKSCDDGNACTADVCDNGTCSNNLLNCDDGDACTADACNGGICEYTNICNPCTLEVISFTLINSLTDTDIGTLEDGGVINLFNTPDVNIRANLCIEPVGSVKFNLNGPTYKIESVAPYSLAGDNSGNYNKWNVSVGNYTLMAIPYPGAGATGTQGVSKTITFTVVNQEAVCSDDSECNDDDLCTADDCNNGACTNGAVNCDDGDACTSDACSAGCTHSPISCDDSNLCTTDDCNSTSGCTHVQDPGCCNNIADCDDSDLCTIDACQDHECVYTPAANGPSYLHVVNAAKSWKKLKLGYGPLSLFVPKNNVVAGGNTDLCITLRGSAGTEWSKIQIRPQGSVSTPVLLGGYGLGTTFTEICIPLTAFGAGVDFTKLTLIEVPYSFGAGAFEIDIQKIEFRGGATPFLWFGDPKTDNFHDSGANGALTATLVPGGPCESATKQQSPAASVMQEDHQTLLQAYPNPFSNHLNISFTVAEASKVKLEIFTVTGQQIASLFDGNLEAGVAKVVEFTPESSSDGMFIYRLQTDKGTYFGKAMMVK